jgi:trimethylamine:corrinoid methyltransferase-like protein
MSCGVCGGQSGARAGFLQVLRFPLPILIPPAAPYSSSITRAGTIGQLVAEVPSGLSLTPLRKLKKKE